MVFSFQGVFKRKYQKRKLSKSTSTSDLRQTKSCEEEYSDSIVTLFYGKEVQDDDSDNYSKSFKLLFNRSELSSNEDVVAVSPSDSNENVIHDNTSLTSSASLPSLPTVSSDTSISSVVERFPSLPSISLTTPPTGRIETPPTLSLPSLPTITCTSIPKKKDSRQTSSYLQKSGSTNINIYESGEWKKIKYDPTTQWYIDASTSTGVGEDSTFINRGPLCPSYVVLPDEKLKDWQKLALKKKAPSVYKSRREFIRTVTNHIKTRDLCQNRDDDYLADDEQSLGSTLSNLSLLD